jgi:hypothetical protein
MESGKMTWEIENVQNMSNEEILKTLQNYESALFKAKSDTLEYKRQLNTLKYKIGKIIE